MIYLAIIVGFIGGAVLTSALDKHLKTLLEKMLVGAVGGLIFGFALMGIFLAISK